LRSQKAWDNGSRSTRAKYFYNPISGKMVIMVVYACERSRVRGIGRKMMVQGQHRQKKCESLFEK
jgi:hypothetical protein